MKNWFEIAAAVYLLVMVLYGHYRGFLRMAVSMGALVITLLVIYMAMPMTVAFIKDKTPIYGWMKEKVTYTLTQKDDPDDVKEWQSVLEELDLPDEIRELLENGGSSDLHDVLNMDILSGYISGYLTDMIVNAVSFVLLFILVNAGLHLMVRWLDLIAKLPVLSGINKLTGALLGGIQGLFFLWVFLLLVAVFSHTGWAGELKRQIEVSKWLSFLYHYNLISKIALGFVKALW